MKTVAIVQSSYIPWKGYFDLIGLVDEFILFDDCQYTKRDWRNRNKIKSNNGALWLSIPVEVKGKYFQKICETKTMDDAWVEKHWKTLKTHYGKARFFSESAHFIEDLYAGISSERYLSRINHHFIKGICKYLSIDTKISLSMDYGVINGKTERLIDLCEKAGASRYLSGPAAKAYIEEEKFIKAGIELLYMTYTGYPEYEQAYPPFDHHVSIVDLIFNTGESAKNYMLSG